MNEEFIQAIAEWWSACWGGTLAEEAEKKAVLEELKGKLIEHREKLEKRDKL
jgi:hypothetical protein